MDKIRLGIIIGSTRPNRFADQPAGWIADLAHGEGFNVDMLDLREVGLPFFEETAPPALTPPRHPIALAWAQRLATCDAFIATAAEYNHAPTAVLKNAFDSAYAEWSRKPIAFVGYGGVGGARAIAHLRDIVSALGMAPIPAGVNIQFADYMAVAQGKETLANLPHLVAAGRSLLVELEWWARVLRDSRVQSKINQSAA